MHINTLNKKLHRLYDNKVSAFEDEYSIVLNGQLDDYQDVLNACKLAVDKKSGKHVVNDIKLKDYQEKEIRKPTIKDNLLDGKKVDVLVIGGGISGCSILRELTKHDISTLLVEKECDLANQASGRNDGEVHPGVDLNKGSLKQHYVKAGNRIYEQICQQLSVDFKRIGQYACFTEWYLGAILFFFVLHRKYICGIDDTKLVGRLHLRKIDSKLNKKFKWAIYNPMAGVVSPYQLTIAYGENAVENGGEVALNTIVESMNVQSGKIVSVKTNRGTIYPKVVVNASGVFAEDIAKMACDRFYSIHPRKGVEFILDKKANYLINTIASIKKLKKSKNNSKGGGLLRTISDNVICGPNAFEVLDKEDYSTDINSVNEIYDKQKDTVPSLDKRDIITYFAGIRPANFEEDFVICKGKRTHNLVHCACIQSPGLTTAPAVALDVEKMVVELLSESMEVRKNEHFNPIRNVVKPLNKMDITTRDKYIKNNPDYGVIVCRCEEISKGEIIDALNRPIKVATIDGIKRRVRPGMGRCQGTFCMPLVAKIIAQHENIDFKDVLKGPENTNIAVRNTKGDGNYE